jgi:hypothetical protein
VIKPSGLSMEITSTPLPGPVGRINISCAGN